MSKVGFSDRLSRQGCLVDLAISGVTFADYELVENDAFSQRENLHPSEGGGKPCRSSRVVQ